MHGAVSVSLQSLSSASVTENSTELSSRSIVNQFHVISNEQVVELTPVSPPIVNREDNATSLSTALVSVGQGTQSQTILRGSQHSVIYHNAEFGQ